MMCLITLQHPHMPVFNIVTRIQPNLLSKNSFTKSIILDVNYRWCRKAHNKVDNVQP
jgi:hypothetical protein